MIYTCAVLKSIQEGLSFAWQDQAPPGLPGKDSWVARYSFSLLAPATANYTFRADVDDRVQMFLDGEPVFSGNAGGSAVVQLSQGYHEAQVHYMEIYGWSGLTMWWNAGKPGSVSKPSMHVTFSLRLWEGLVQNDCGALTYACHACWRSGLGEHYFLLSLSGALVCTTTLLANPAKQNHAVSRMGDVSHHFSFTWG